MKEGEVVVTKNEMGQIVCVTRQDEEGRILSVLAESAVPPVDSGLSAVVDEKLGLEEIVFRIPIELKSALNFEAKRRGLIVPAVIRQILLDYFDEDGA